MSLIEENVISHFLKYDLFSQFLVIVFPANRVSNFDFLRLIKVRV